MSATKTKKQTAKPSKSANTKKVVVKPKTITKKIYVKLVWPIFGATLILLSLVFGGFRIIDEWLNGNNAHTTYALPSTPLVETAAPLISGTPTRIMLPNVNINLSVYPGYYYPETMSWTLSDRDAHWGSMTSPANNKSGVTYIYAHAKAGVFMDLANLKPGAKAIVTTDNNHTFSYVYKSSAVISPDDTSLFNYTGEPILVLQTCTGVWSQYRELYTFSLAEAL